MGEIEKQLEGSGLKFRGIGQGSRDWTKCHRYNYVEMGEYQYLISFEPLTYHNPKTNHSGEYSLDKATGHCVYNTALTVQSSGEESMAFINILSIL